MAFRRQENLYLNTHIFIHENVLENAVRKMTAILSQPQYVNLSDAETGMAQTN